MMPTAQPDTAVLDPRGLVDALLDLGDDAGHGVAIQASDDGRYLFVNRTLAAFFDLAPEQLIGRCASEWLSPATAAALRENELQAARAWAAMQTMQPLGSGSAARIFRAVCRPLPSSDASAVTMLYCVWSEVLASEQAAFEAHLRRETDLASREQREFALLSIAADHPLTTGPVGGEAIEDRTWNWLQEQVRAMDAVFRIAPGQYKVLLSGVGLAVAHGRAGSLLRMHRERISDVPMTIGIASCPHTERDPNALVSAADGAMQRAREQGGDRIAVARIRFDPPA
jgi:GGDEF domain-containing protein